MGLCIKGNNRSNGIVRRHLEETFTNSFDYFEEQVHRRTTHSMWDTELEIKVEELFRAGVYEPIFDLLLVPFGAVEQWSHTFGNRFNIDWCDLFSDFQLYLLNMLDYPVKEFAVDGSKNTERYSAKKVYNRDISFMNNLYKQLECESKDKRKFLDRDKRADDQNSESPELMEQRHHNSTDMDFCIDSDYLMDLQSIAGVSPDDLQIIVGLATGEIGKQDIPEKLRWRNIADTKKLTRYMRRIAEILAKI